MEVEGLTIILMRIIARNVDEHEDNHLDSDIHNGDDDNYGNNNTSGGVHRACVGHYLWSLWFNMEVINLLLIHHNTEVRQKKATVQHVMYGHSSKC